MVTTAWPCAFSRRTSADPMKPAPPVTITVMCPSRGYGEAWRGLRRVPCIAEARSEEHTSELQSLMRISYAVFCLKKKNNRTDINNNQHTQYSTKHKTTTYA